MAARKTPSRGGKPDKLMRDAISLVLHEETSVPDPLNSKRIIRLKKLRLVATALVHAAIKGDVSAIKEINDRMDGKVVQKIGGDTPDGAIPIDIKNLSAQQIEQLKERVIADLVAKGRIRPPVARGA